MIRLARTVIFTSLFVVVIAASGCGGNGMRQQAQTSSGPVSVNGSAMKGIGSNDGITALKTAQGHSEQAVIGTVSFDGKPYVPGGELARVLQFQTRWEAKERLFKMGDYDAAFEWKADVPEVRNGDEPIQLPEAPIIRNALVYIPVSALFVLQDDMSYSVTEKELIIEPASGTVNEPMNGPAEPGTGGENDFADDPDDPLREAVDSEADAGGVRASADGPYAAGWNEDYAPSDEATTSALPAAVRRNTDMLAILRKAKAYLGVGYSFAAPPYPSSSRFDSSSYPQYVFNRHGITLQSSARGQAAQGTSVSRKKLRKGDLLFFNVPGRYRTNRTVGHVGIYMGNNRMIHAAPRPVNGVQMTNINNAYWEKTFLFARRIPIWKD
ncbi:C40 family peptidase [Paenibacillus piri]|uniref:NlpC/P60 domain-containing protein n=1 Tax=Paenibacillus piri TaxID=2547395 RepID=A0A4R5KX86_9BACL|nr:C40 family peptidase [Paenibacillus piri]TDG00644.1 hypothetical protein E1757_03180 [Paenibacillus piri]